MKKTIEKWYKKLNFPKAFDEQFYQILETEELDSNLTINDYDFASDNGKKNLLMYLYYLENLEKQYIKNNIPLEILYDTAQDIVRWTKTWSELKGELWLEELEWLSFSLSFRLFKIGRLQYNMAKALEDIPEHGIAKGDPVVEIHIPPTGPLTPQECEKSFREAKAFLKKYFPDFRYKAFTCRSWLLGENLAKYLRPDSNIMHFQSFFTPIKAVESYNILKYVFRWDARKENLLTFEAKTPFAERIKQAVLDGEKFYSTLGVKKRLDSCV